MLKLEADNKNINSSRHCRVIIVDFGEVLLNQKFRVDCFSRSKIYNLGWILTLKKLVKHELKYLRVVKQAAFPNKAIVTESFSIQVAMSIFLGVSTNKILCFLSLFEIFLFFFKMITFLLVFGFYKKLRRTLMTLM